ncbi:hypothetical protein AB0L62_20145 [Nocardia asteroides]|uniref:hypothetical protein n=1 Tax=Nocardia asteroides TaxID=1824 RepID=UPI003425F270
MSHDLVETDTADGSNSPAVPDSSMNLAQSAALPRGGKANEATDSDPIEDAGPKPAVTRDSTPFSLSMAVSGNSRERVLRFEEYGSLN